MTSSAPTGKTDTLDAASAARAVLSGRATASAKTGNGPVETLRIFKLAKVSAIKALTQTINQEHQITTAVTSHTPQLLTRRGIGPDNAAALLIAAGDNPDRLRSEASFAALRGVNPLEAS